MGLKYTAAPASAEFSTNAHLLTDTLLFMSLDTRRVKKLSAPPKPAEFLMN